MNNLEYKIIKDKKFGKIDMQINNEKYEPIAAFFSFAFPENYIDIINSAINGIGITFNDSGVIFPKDAEEDGFILQENIVRIGIFDESIDIPRIDFLNLLLNCSIANYELRVELGKATSEWQVEMEKGINRLKDYIKNPDFKV